MMRTGARCEEAVSFSSRDTEEQEDLNWKLAIPGIKAKTKYHCRGDANTSESQEAAVEIRSARTGFEIVGQRDSTSSPAINKFTLVTPCTIAAKERRQVATADVKGAFLGKRCVHGT
jgi:hypothetical protein